MGRKRDILAILCTALLLSACAPTGNVIAEKPLTLGAILPLSGDFALFGIEAQRGLELARKELAAQGIAVQIIYEDDRTLDATAIITAANKLTANDDVDIIVSLFIDHAEVLKEVIDETQTPLVLIWDNNQRLKTMSPRIFSTGFSSEAQGERMAEFAADTLGIKRVAIVEDIAPSAEVLANALRAQAKEEKLTIVTQAKTYVGESDYRTLITQLKEKNIEGVYLDLYNPEPFFSQAHELDFETTFFAFDSFTSDMMSIVTPYNQSTYFTGLSSEHPELITALYRVAYGEDPHYLDVVSLGYDGLHAFANIIPDQTTQQLRALMGEDQTLDRVESIYTLVDGQRTLVEE